MVAYRALVRDEQRREGARWYRVGERWIEERRVSGEQGRVVGACLDVTDRRRREEVLTWEAEHDPLTGLLSRRSFDRLLERAAGKLDGRGATVSLLMVDLDGFKTVNDRQGHAIGDELLGAIAGRLRGALRQGDPVARWGGDEFAVLLASDTQGLRAGSVAQRLLTAIHQPVRLGPVPLTVHASVGVAVLEADEGLPSLAERADRALYAAKRAGGARWCLDGWAP